MKKYIFIISCLLLIQLVMAQSPGGQSTNLSLWYKADAGVTQSGTVSQWDNQASSLYNLTQGTAANRPTYNTSMINFNPSIRFDGVNDVLSATSVPQNVTISGANPYATSHYVVYKSLSTPNSLFNHSNGSGGTWNIGSHSNGNVLISNRNIVTVTPNIGDVRLQVLDGNSNAASSYLNGLLISSTLLSTTAVAGNQSFWVGAQGTNQFTNVDIGEIVVYNVSQLNRQRIESYLTLKYGITKSGDYIASNGTTTYWSAASNSGYTNNIAGIGRDDNSSLHQRQSQSQNTGAQPVIGNNSAIIATNTSGVGDFATDNNFMLWGSDTGSDRIETAFAFGSTNYRMGKIWKIQETNTVGTVKVALRKSDFNGLNQHLLVSNDATFDGTDTMIAMTEETIGGIVYYTATVDFTDGQFFTFASFISAPGGVLSALEFWYRPEVGVTISSGKVTNWTDQIKAYNATPQTPANGPAYNATGSNMMNFNPSITFTNATRQDALQASGLPAIPTGVSSFTILKPTDASSRWFFHWGVSGAGYYKNYGACGANSPGVWTNSHGGCVNNPTTFGPITTPSFVSSRWSSTAGVNQWQMRLNGQLHSGTTSSTNLNVPSNTTLEFGDVNNRTAGNEYVGEISEVIGFTVRVNDNDRQKIESYLSLKYGITYKNDANTGINNYLLSDNSIVWNATANVTYNNNIAGIGRDDASALNQKQSQSQNTGNHVIFGLGTVAATNATNANTFTADKQFLLWGDNGASGPVAFSDASDSSIFSRLARTWFVDNSNSYAQDTQLLIPVALTTGGSSPKLILNANDAFASGTNTYIPLSTTTSINSVSYYVVNLTAAQVANDFYFTIATNQKAPGGVATGLQLWMKANDGWSATNWIDRSSNGFTATRFGTPTQTKRVNFHPTISFTPGNYYNIPHNTLLNQNSQNQITVAAVFTTTPRTYNSFMAKTINANWDNGWQLATENSTVTNRLGFNTGDWTGGAPSYAAFQNIPILNPAIAFGYSTGNTGFANFISISGKVATQSTANVNTQVSTSDLRIGDAGGYGYEGDLSEALMYNQNNAADKARIDSYLALKYGITLDQTTPNNYVNSSGNIIWNGTNNSGFANDIAGIVRDDFSTLNQVMSKSVNSNAEPILSLTSIPVTNLNDTHASTNVFDNNNQSLVWGNNAIRGFTSFTNPIDVNITHRLSRVWKAETFNYNLTGDDDIVFNFTKGSLQSFINSDANYYLVLSTTSDFSSNNYFIQLPSLFTNIDGIDYISTIYDVSSNAFSGLLANGTFYFTVAGKGTGPGGVLGIFWNRADKEVTTSGSNVSKWTDQMFGIESTQVRANTNVPSLGTNVNLFNFNPYLDFTNTNQSLGNEFVAPTEGFTGHIEQFFVTKDNAYSGRLFGLNYDLKLSANGGSRYDWNCFTNSGYASRNNLASGGASATAFSPALSTTLQNLSHLISTSTSNTFGYRYNGASLTNSVNANYNYIGQGGFIYGANNQGGIGGDDAGVTAQLAEHLIVGEALTATQRRQVESYLAVKYGITISDLTSDASYRDASGNATFTSDVTFRHDIFGIAKEAAAGIDQRISKSINNDAGNATNIITVSTDTNYTNMNLTHSDGLSDGQYLIFASNNGAVAFTGGSAITASDGTVFSATEVLATRWKVQDKGAVGCVNMRFNNAVFTAVTGSTKYYMIVADDAAFTQNVTYREVTRDASSNIDVTVNFGDNTNGSATTGNYFTIARKNLGITPENLTLVQTGINTIPSNTNWKPTVANTYMEINSNTKGVIVSRVNGTSAIASPVEGMLLFDTSDSKFKVFTGSSWRTLGNAEGTSTTFCN